MASDTDTGKLQPNYQLGVIQVRLFFDPKKEKKKLRLYDRGW